MKKIILITALALVAIAAIAWATGNCDGGRSCCKNKNKTSMNSTSCDNCCKESGACLCDDCSAECKAKCDAEGHCVCRDDCSLQKISSKSTSAVTASCCDENRCNAASPCSCDDCDVVCMEKCEKAGHCVCN